MKTRNSDPGLTRKPLTASAIAAMRPGDELTDDKVPGLSVRCGATKKSFMLYYRADGVTRRPKIGDGAVMSIANARQAARGILQRVARGEDPSGERQARQSEPAVADLWAECKAIHWNRGKSWDQEAERIYTRHIAPHIAAKRVREISIEDARNIRDGMKATPALANHALAVLGKMLSLAETIGPEGNHWRPIGSNPCQRVPKFRIKSRRRYASADEIKSVHAALARHESENPSGVAFIRLLMFTGARPSEIENATPEMVERFQVEGQACGVLRLPTGKNGDARDVFLPPQAMAVLDSLPVKRKQLAGRPKLPRKLWQHVRDEAGCGDLWARDWRRTFATVGFSSGISIGIVGDLLGHRDAATTRVYAKLIETSGLQAAVAIGAKMEALSSAQ